MQSNSNSSLTWLLQEAGQLYPHIPHTSGPNRSLQTYHTSGLPYRDTERYKALKISTTICLAEYHQNCNSSKPLSRTSGTRTSTSYSLENVSLASWFKLISVLLIRDNIVLTLFQLAMKSVCKVQGSYFFSIPLFLPLHVFSPIVSLIYFMLSRSEGFT